MPLPEGQDGVKVAVRAGAGGRARFGPPAAGDLLAALLHREGVLIARRAVPSKTHEIPGLHSLLAPLDIPDRVATGDALHAQAETARFLVEDKQAHWRPAAQGQPAHMSRERRWGPRLFPPPHVTLEKGHGRIERREVSWSTALAGYSTFPHLQQVLRVERTT